MEISFCNTDNKNYQNILNVLLKEVFFDFKFWYDLNLWDTNYESYSIIENDVMLSNICVYKAKILMGGKTFEALSLGAVATKKEFRGKGLSRKLMRHIMAKYPDTPMYLNANKNVINFYPKFGFKMLCEQLPVANLNINNSEPAAYLEYGNPKVRSYIYNRVNFSSKLDCLNAQSINMFHIYSGVYNSNIYELKNLDTLLIAKQNAQTLKINAVFSLKNISFKQLAKALPFTGINKIEFGFMPCWNDLKFEMLSCEQDPWFIKNVGCNLNSLKFPELCAT